MFQRAIYRHREEPELVFAFLRGRPGVFVEVGANDPVEGSQSYRLEQELGWTGLLVEPLLEHAEDLRRRRRAAVAQVACGPPGCHGQWVEFKVAGVSSTLAREFINYRRTAKEVRQVQVMTLDSLLEHHGIDHIDFLSLDVEGYEVEVMEGLNFEKYRPRLILIEDRVRDLQRHRYLTSKGYKIVRRSGANGWYVPVNASFPVSVLGRLQLFWKYTIEQPFRGWYDRRRRRRATRREA
jgi:FkbM family methyltransferase